MHRRVVRWGSVCAVLCAAWSALSATPVRAQFALNEILAAPSSDWDHNGAVSSRDDEWIEIVNTSDSPMAMDSLLVRDGTHKTRYRFSGTLAPHAYLVVYGAQAYAWEKANGQAADGLSLNNTGDTVDLMKITSPVDTILCDERVYTSAESAAERSVGRQPDGTGEWVLFDLLNPYTSGGNEHATNCAPSPGGSNTLCGTPVRPSTWGRIKALYSTAPVSTDARAPERS